MKQKAKSIVTALLLGVLCAVTLSAVITVPDWETARADLLIGMQYETTGLDLDAVPGWLTALVMLHQNFPLDGWAWGPAAAGLAVLLCWVRGQREAKPKRTELVLSIVFGIAEVLGLSICKLGSWAFVFKNPYQLCVGVLCMAGYAVLFYHAVWGLYALLGRSRTGVEDFPQTRFAAWFTKAPGRASSLLIGAAWLPWVAVFWPGSVDWDSWGQISQVLGVQEMTAHHTVLSTWLHGWLFRLGRALGSDNLGVFLYIALQFLVCAWVFGQVTAFAARLGCSRGVQYAVTAFFALDPIWGAFIQTQVKDTLYTGLFVLFVLKTADLLLFPQEWQGSRPRLTAYAVLGVLCCLLRKNGIYAVVPMLLASAFTVSEKRLRRPVLAVLLAAAPLAPAEEAPNVTELMNSYTELDLSPYLGKTVFINFFTEWCYYCMQEMPDIKALYDTYSEDELAIVLVHVWDGENADNTASVKGKYGMEDMTFFEDEDMMVASLVGLQGYPASLFLNPDGTLEAAANYMLTLEQMTGQLDAMGVARKAAEE